MKSQESRQLQAIKGISEFYNGPEREILELQERAKDESIENMVDDKKVFSVKIGKKRI